MSNNLPTGTVQLLSQLSGLSSHPLQAADITNSATQRFDAANNHIYEFVDSVVTWQQAQTLASQKSIAGISGYLATVTSGDEQSFLATNNPGLIGPWIGGSDAAVQGQWQWVNGPEVGTLFWTGGTNGTPVAGSYTDWMPGEPNNFGGVEKYTQDYLSGSATGWNDNSATFLSTFIVEYSGTITNNVPDKLASGLDNSVGKTLYSSTANLADADGLGTLHYQWQRSLDGMSWQNITGSTASSYVLQTADAYQRVRVAVSYIDGAGSAEIVFSTADQLISPSGTDGNDIIHSTLSVPRAVEPFHATSYYIDGKTGFDIVTYDSPLVTNGQPVTIQVYNDHSIGVGVQGINLGFGPINMLYNVEEAKFSDYTVVFDLTSSQDKLVYEIYQAAYARVPDNSGFRYWATQADAKSLSAISLADSFLAAPEYFQRYGAPDNLNYVAELYTNVLGRAPDQTGLAFWVNAANQGLPKDQLLVSFATSPENLAFIAPHVSGGFWTV